MQPIGDLAQATHGRGPRLAHRDPCRPGFAQTPVHHPPANLTLQQLNALLPGLRRHLLTDEFRLTCPAFKLCDAHSQLLCFSRRLLELVLHLVQAASQDFIIRFLLFEQARLILNRREKLCRLPCVPKEHPVLEGTRLFRCAQTISHLP